MADGFDNSLYRMFDPNKLNVQKSVAELEEANKYSAYYWKTEPIVIRLDPYKLNLAYARKVMGMT